MVAMAPSAAHAINNNFWENLDTRMQEEALCSPEIAMKLVR